MSPRKRSKASRASTSSSTKPTDGSMSFEAELYDGHTEDSGVIVPFDASKAWPKAETRWIGYRKHEGYAVQGVVRGEPFESWIWLYHRAWRMVVPNATLATIGASAGDVLSFVVRPHTDPDGSPPLVPGPKRAERSSTPSNRASSARTRRATKRRAPLRKPRG